MSELCRAIGGAFAMAFHGAIAVVLIVLLIFASEVWAEKVCPAGGEVYPDSANFCGIHGEKLVPRKPAAGKPSGADQSSGAKKAVPRKAEKKTAEATSPGDRALKVYVQYNGGKQEIFEFKGFGADCDGYGKEGIRYAEQGTSITIPWRDVEFILPASGTARLKNGHSIESAVLQPGSCAGASILEIRKKVVLIAGYEREKEEELKIALSEMEVIAFGGKSFDEGRTAREAIVQKAEQAKRETEEERRRWAEEHERLLSEGFVLVRGGCYQMGDTFGDGEGDERPVHEVCVADFYMGRYEVTQGQWRGVMGSNPSHFRKCGDGCPVENVAWSDVQDFIGRLNARGGRRYRLPTEAEWEYAARSGGRAEKYAGGGDADTLAWHTGNSGNGIHPAGQKRPNGLGLYDMSGNVWEWCADWYGEGYYGSSPGINPSGPSSGTYRVLRGGAWNYITTTARAANRYGASPGDRYDSLGFRLAVSLP